MTDSEKLKLCSGCRNDFYNGHNELGIARCWSLDTAKPARAVFVHLDSVPPWNEKPENTLSCHHRQRFVRVQPDHPQLVKMARK